MSIQLVIMYYNAADSIVSVLESWYNVVDSFILVNATPPTGNTDSTEEVINHWVSQCKKPVVVRKINFTTFAESRNKCLEIAYSSKNTKKYKWTAFVDDSYELSCNDVNAFHNELNSLNVSCISMSIYNLGMIYTSKRIVRTSAKIMYVGSIHENFNSDSHYTIQSAHINDKSYDSHRERSMSRLENDFKLLGENYEDPRVLYYKAMIGYQLQLRGKIDISEVIWYLNKRTCMKDYDFEEKFICYVFLGNIANGRGDVNGAVMNYICAALVYPNRSGEAYYFAYNVSHEMKYLQHAYECCSLPMGSRMPMDSRLYTQAYYIGIIEQTYMKVTETTSI